MANKDDDDDDGEHVAMHNVNNEDEPHNGWIDQNAEDLDAKFPNRPFNHSVTLPFHDLIESLFSPLIENRKKPKGPIINRKKQGPDVKSNSPMEMRKSIISRFVSKWKQQVGNDIFPAFRLILPDKDRDRAMYGLKEKTIGKLLVRIMKIDKNSEDGQNILNWRLPGYKGTASSMAGDFAGRCFEVLKKRPIRTTYGNLSIGDVNEMLDKLSAAQKEENQLPVFQEFYQKMNPEEMLWLIRVILRQMKIGATEKTILEMWHPDAENLFNVSSSLRRVCWELYDSKVRLDGEDSGISLMQCFQPQLAAFQMHSMEKMVQRMNPIEGDDDFWIEEKLDGERMQLHMVEDSDMPGGYRFCFWSRKAKDYTYLYGNSFQDEEAALTRHIRDAFHENVRNIILDGEMITWDPEQDAIVSFGTLKTAALAEQKNPFAGGKRPLFKVFDCLYLNDTVLTSYTLRDRYKALRASIKDVHRRLEVHHHDIGHHADEIEPYLRKVIAESSEGLVLKNPRSMYRLNDRNDDWMKVKPEYMTEFGEALDCIVIGGYYGSGKRGGRLSSFLCGLRVDSTANIPKRMHGPTTASVNEMKCFSFFKVGGGFSAPDYADIRHLTEGKWHDWDVKKPPTEYIELAGGERQFERPDVWIRPDESVVFEVKAASVTTTDQFRMGSTLRFPRFKKLRQDKDWKSALSMQEFKELKQRAEEDKQEKQLRVDDARKTKRSKRRKKGTVVVGQEDVKFESSLKRESKLFDGKSFLILTDQIKPKKSKVELEQLVKINGGKIVQTDRDDDTICIADKNVVKVASISKMGKKVIVRPKWLFDCVKQAESDGLTREPFQLPYEPDVIFSCPDDQKESYERNVDKYGDSFARNINVEDLRLLLAKMPTQEVDDTTIDELRSLLDMK